MQKHFLPITKKELDYLGWDYVDVIIVNGDAYVDHPSFGAAVIGRTLERAGLRVAILPQPNWQDDLRDFKKLGKPRLFFGVTSGNMDSMVNHYTANKRLRSDDAYTAGGKAGFRPDYATTVYSKILKQIYPTATFHVVKNEKGQPYFVDPNVGIMVFTELTIEGHTTECFLCVMDSKNKAMKLQPYQYQSFNSYKKEYETKTVNAATMFDINKTIWRCLVKNVAIATGIGLNIFQGEDLNDKASEEQNNVPQTQVSQRPAYPQTPQPQVPVDYVVLKNSINGTADVAGLVSLYLENTQAIEANPEIKALLSARKKALQSLNA